MAEKKKFIYTIEQHDKDATNARSESMRHVRNNVGLPVDEKNALTAEAKKIHTACGTAGRKTATAVEKGLTTRKKREDWTPEQTVKAHRLIAEKALAAYVAALVALGYEVDEKMQKVAMKSYEARLVERKAESEAAWIVQQDTDFGDIFGDEE